MAHLHERKLELGDPLGELQVHTPVLYEGHGDVLLNAHGSEERPALEEHPDHLPGLLQLFFVQAGQVAAIEEDAAAGGLVEPDEISQQGRFAAAAGAKNGQNLPAPDLEVDVSQLGPVLAPVTEGEVPDRDGRVRQGMSGWYHPKR